MVSFCMFPCMMHLDLAPDDRQLLQAMLRATTLSAGLARRARVILALADGQSYGEVGARFGVTDAFIARWKQRVVASGVAALGIARAADARIDWIRGLRRKFWPARRRRPPRRSHSGPRAGWRR